MKQTFSTFQTFRLDSHLSLREVLDAGESEVVQ